MNEALYPKLGELRARGDAALSEMREVIDEMVAIAADARRGNRFYIRNAYRAPRFDKNGRVCG